MPTTKKPYLKKTAVIEDLATREFSVRFQIRTENGERRAIEIPRADLTDLKQLQRKLMANGAVLPIDNVELKNFLDAASKANCNTVLKRAAHSGWSSDNRTFVLQSKIIGLSSTEIIGIRPSLDREDRGRLSTSGTSSNWKANVASKATTSSHFMLCIAAAFAAPLLKLCKQDSYSVCLSGYSRSGKSFATLMGASVIGLGDPARMLTWNTTPAALDECFPMFNDCLAPIDDFETIKGTDAQKYQLVRDFSYGISSGAEKRRHSSFGPPQKRWRTIMITSMEKPISQLAKQAKATRQPGESIRMIDVPLLSRSGDHIFDRAEAAGIPITQSWRREHFAAIIEACAESHGTIFRRYLRMICKKPKDTSKRAKKFAAWFANEVSLTEDGGLAGDLARKLGWIYAGGRLAIRLGLLPWKQSELFAAIQACYEAARDLLPDYGAIKRAGIAKLKEKLASLKRRRDITSFGAVAGYQIVKQKRLQCLIRVDAFNSLFDSPDQRRLVIEWLREKKRITLNKPKGSQNKVKPKEQFVWPDGERPRSYEIIWPKSELAR